MNISPDDIQNVPSIFWHHNLQASNEKSPPTPAVEARSILCPDCTGNGQHQTLCPMTSLIIISSSTIIVIVQNASEQHLETVLNL